MIRNCLLVMMIFALAGCQINNQQTEHPIIAKTATDESMKQIRANEAVEKVLQREEVVRANAINTDKLILLAFEVEQFERFNLKTIEKQIKKQLKKEFDNMEVVVSYDPKIMLEIEKLQNKLQSGDITEKTLKKEAKKIVKLKKEKT